VGKPLDDKIVVLGITGSIAAYKGVEVARRLMDLGADVHATLTQSGAKFITPLTLRTLTHNPVTLNMFDEPEEWDVKHVSLAQRAAAVVIAPASANAIAKLALGLADEFIYTLALASTAPLLLAPAMNDRMLAHPKTQEHLAALQARGAHVIAAETGRLASGAVGTGKLADPAAIAAAVADIVTSSNDLTGLRFLVTAGPTREPLDPVRFLSNRSSGKMGYALAERAARRGARVTLVTGPTALAFPAGCEVITVETTSEMLAAVEQQFGDSDVLIAAAAPADYAPAQPAGHKLKKTAALTLELKATPDLLAECGKNKRPSQILVGFAAETQNLIENAAAKLNAKQLDLIIANDVSRSDIGFDAEENAGIALSADGKR
jgi:phosphopantothenoylcysteine decarboxylase / phosphopantothenate---cysteine ligase